MTPLKWLVGITFLGLLTIDAVVAQQKTDDKSKTTEAGTAPAGEEIHGMVE